MKTKLIEYTMRHIQAVQFLTEHGSSILAVAIGMYMMFGRI